MKLLKLNRKATILLIVMGVTCGGVAGSMLYNQNESKGECGIGSVSDKIRATNNFYTPCELIITVADPSNTNITDIQKMAQSINGTIQTNNSPGNGIYFINVPPGTEDEAVRFLNSQSTVKSASRNYCCAVSN